MLKQNNIIKGKYEVEDKILEFMTATCYNKITSEKANNIMDKVTEGQYGKLNKKEYSQLFEYNPTINERKIIETMNEVNKLLLEIDEEKLNGEEEEFDEEKYIQELEKKYKRKRNYGMPHRGRKEGGFENDEKIKSEKNDNKEKNKKNKRFQDSNDIMINIDRFLNYVGIRNFYTSLIMISLTSLFLINKKKKNNNM